MLCAGCQFENPDGARFCNQCGAALIPVCGTCGAANPEGARFCNGCGNPLGVTPAAATDPSGVASRDERAPADYTPAHLADRILHSRSAMEGERKVVTVLFADVKGSMALAAELGAEDWHHTLDRYFEILSEGVHRFEGVVNQYTGDGIMALFGAPIAHEDHAQRACLAALWLQGELREFAHDVKRRHGVDFQTRLGLNSGEVIVGKIGDDLRMDYTAQGHTVGLAQRMESLASAGSVYLAPATAALAAGYFSFEDLGEFHLKGVAEPVHAFELNGLGAARTRFDLSRSRGLSRFVGRNAEMEALESALERARTGNGQVVGIVAEAGTGKSRLSYEFVERCRERGLRVQEGRCVAHGKTLPFLPILEVIRAYYGISERDDDREAREKIAGRMLLFDESYRDMLPILFDFLGIPDPEQPSPTLPPEARQRRLFSVSRDLLQAGNAPGQDVAIVLVEDLHWLDGGSEAWIEQWVDATAGGRALLVVNFRPEYRADWMQRVHYQQLALAPLSPDAIQDLLSDLIGNHESTDGLARRIHEHTAGNPFFAEEVVQSLIESGQLTGERGAYRLSRSIAKLDVPPSVQALLAARIDRLAEREKHVLQAASVIGKVFDEPLLLEVASVGEAELRDALATLRNSEFVYEQSLFPVAEYTFKHPLTQAVALDSILRERRRELHAAAARAVEARTTDPDADAALLAHHWEGAGEALRAAEWHLRAANHVGGNDVQEMAKHTRAIIDLLRAREDESGAAGLLANAASLLVGAGWRLGAGEEGDALFADGRRWAQRAGDDHVEARILGARAAVVALRGGLREAVDIIEEFTAAADRSGDAGLAAIARTWGGYPRCKLGELAESARRIRHGMEAAADDPELGVEFTGGSIKGLAYSWQLDIDALIAHRDVFQRTLDEGMRFVRDRGESEAECYMLGSASQWIAEIYGDTTDVARMAHQMMTLAESLGGQLALAYALECISAAEILDGRVDDALASAERALAIQATVQTNVENGAVVRSLRTRALLAAGRGEEALASATDAVAHTKLTGARIYEPRVLLDLARVHLAAGNPVQASSALDRAQRSADAMGARNLLPQITWRRAEIAAAGGDDAAHERLIAEARSGFEAIGAAGLPATVAPQH